MVLTDREERCITIRADIAFDWVKSQKYYVKWTVYCYENNEIKLVNFNIPTDNTITIPEFLLPFGLIKVEINVSMSHSLFDHLFTVNERYLKVNVTNLPVEIMDGEEGLERHGRQVTLSKTFQLAAFQKMFDNLIMSIQ